MKRHLDGDGGIRQLLPIAVPMILTSVFDTLMTFIDRVYLSYVGKTELSASFSAGITSWMCICLFVGLIGYTGAVVAQFYGAKRYTECPHVVEQSLRLAFLCYPLCLLTCWLGAFTFGGEGHDPEQARLERIYFWYLSFGCIVALLRGAYCGFFAGIGKTKIIMVANCVALVVNLTVNYVLIFGKFGCPAMGIRGAAIGTVLAGLAMALIVMFQYYREIRKPPFVGTPSGFDWGKLRTLVVYGAPSGVGQLLGMGSFVVIVYLLNAYGADVAAATTITFNWDNVSFFPLIGLQTGVSTLVGQFMGAQKPELAERSAYSGFKLALSYSICGVFAFCLFPHILVGVFTPEGEGLDYAQVRTIAIPMLRAAALYLLFDAIHLISSGALFGAGDTLWTTVLNVCLSWIGALGLWVTIRILNVSPIQAWITFVFFVMFHSVIIYVRFRLGGWKNIRMIQDKERG
ncbi:MAG: MATE family efflux transporter [Victivallales bacterium]|nr:MATE family efflux transporter [Victivallales bacterium]